MRLQRLQDCRSFTWVLRTVLLHLLDRLRVTVCVQIGPSGVCTKSLYTRLGAPSLQHIHHLTSAQRSRGLRVRFQSPLAVTLAKDEMFCLFRNKRSRVFARKNCYGETDFRLDTVVKSSGK